MADAEDLKSAKYFVLFTNKYLNKRGFGHNNRPRLSMSAGGYKWESEQLHDYVLFAANTGLRPDEAWRLQFRDVKIVEDDPSGQNEPCDRGARQARCRLLP